MTQPTTCRVIGDVANIGLRPIPGVVLRFAPEVNRLTRAGNTTIVPDGNVVQLDRSGSFEVHLLPGRYIVTARRENGQVIAQASITVPQATIAYLAQILDLPPPPTLNAAEQAVVDAQSARDRANEAAEAAEAAKIDVMDASSAALAVEQNVLDAADAAREAAVNAAAARSQAESSALDAAASAQTADQISGFVSQQVTAAQTARNQAVSARDAAALSSASAEAAQDNALLSENAAALSAASAQSARIAAEAAQAGAQTARLAAEDAQDASESAADIAAAAQAAIEALLPQIPSIPQNANDLNTEGVALGNVSGAQALSCTAAQVFTATITGATTFSFTNASAYDEIVLHLTNPGSAAITWPASVDWPGGTAPSLTAAGVDVLVFVTHNGGTIWRGALAMKDVK